MNRAIISILLRLLTDHCLEQQESCMGLIYEYANCSTGDSECGQKLQQAYKAFCHKRYESCMKAGDNARKIQNGTN